MEKPDLACVIPIVRGTQPIRLVPEPGSKTEIVPVVEDFAPGLRIYYAFDRPDRFVYMAAEHLQSLDVAAEELFDLATANFRDRVEQIKQHHLAAGCYMLTIGNKIESSLLLLAELWTAEWSRIDGPLVVGVPTRDVLVVADGSSPEALERLERGIVSVWDDPDTPPADRVSRRKYVFERDRWCLLEGEVNGEPMPSRPLALPDIRVSVPLPGPPTSGLTN